MTQVGYRDASRFFLLIDNQSNQENVFQKSMKIVCKPLTSTWLRMKRFSRTLAKWSINKESDLREWKKLWLVLPQRTSLVWYRKKHQTIYVRKNSPLRIFKKCFWMRKLAHQNKKLTTLNLACTHKPIPINNEIIIKASERNCVLAEV